MSISENMLSIKPAAADAPLSLLLGAMIVNCTFGILFINLAAVNMLNDPLPTIQIFTNAFY